MAQEDAGEIVGDLFRREAARLVAALARVLGPSNLALAEDVVQDALLGAMQAWQAGAPHDPRAWILRAAKNRAIDVIRRSRRKGALEPSLASELELAGAVDRALSPDADDENQLAMMFAICDDALATETHVTLVLRWLCGLSAPEIARAFLVDVQTIDRRLHRGREHLRRLGRLPVVDSAEGIRARQPSVERALYLLFNEGYHGSGAESPLAPALCADALRLSELLLHANGVETGTVHALSALFCFNAARLSTRMDADGVMLPLAEQDRSLWDRALIARGCRHLGESAGGDRLTRWHLEAGVAFEHTSAPSLEATNWVKIVQYYDALHALAPGPIVALNRGVALAELHGPDAGRQALQSLLSEARLAGYSFFWAALADIERRAGNAEKARTHYLRAAALAKSRAERLSYERRLGHISN